jgi:hypothetical protein
VILPAEPVYCRDPDAIVDSKGRPLNFSVTGGEVHDSQDVGDVLDTPRPPLAVTAEKAYDSEKVRQQIKDEGALPVKLLIRTGTASFATATARKYLLNHDRNLLMRRNQGNVFILKA